MNDLKRVLKEITANDLNYERRYVLVFEAVSLALGVGIAAGIRIDPSEPDWPVIYIDLPTGQVSWHMPQFADAWDGHDTDEKYRRVKEFVQS
jgi:hypothetical protein